MVGGKSKLNALSYSTDPSYGISYQASTNCTDITDNEVYANLVSIMDTHHPRLMIVNLPDTDKKGHIGFWPNYVAALTNADALVYQLWQKIESDAFYQNTTTLFITNDHGRHDIAHGDFQHHGDDCDGCEHIMLLAMGRNVVPGVENAEIHYRLNFHPSRLQLLMRE